MAAARRSAVGRSNPFNACDRPTVNTQAPRLDETEHHHNEPAFRVQLGGLRIWASQL